MSLEFVDFSVQVLFFLFLAAFVAGFIDTLAGGGGLIALPALIMSGIPPLLALGTNKLQGTMGTATAALMMLRGRRVSWGEVKFLMLTACIGSALGTCVLQFINADVLNFIIPCVLLFIALYFLISPQPEKGGEQRVSASLYRNVIVPVIGWYDGMFGPGAGSFFALAGVSLQGRNLLDSTAVAKTLNFSTNIASLLVFLAVGKVVWIAGLVMMVGQFSGAWAGSNCLFRINPKYLRFVIVVMCFGMLGKYVMTSLAS
jgi:uncharacterized membrane protein YfcA